MKILLMGVLVAIVLGYVVPRRLVAVPYSGAYPVAAAPMGYASLDASLMQYRPYGV